MLTTGRYRCHASEGSPKTWQRDSEGEGDDDRIGLLSILDLRSRLEVQDRGLHLRLGYAAHKNVSYGTSMIGAVTRAEIRARLIVFLLPIMHITPSIYVTRRAHRYASSEIRVSLGIENSRVDITDSLSGRRGLKERAIHRGIIRLSCGSIW